MHLRSVITGEYHQVFRTTFNGRFWIYRGYKKNDNKQKSGKDLIFLICKKVWNINGSKVLLVLLWDINNKYLKLYRVKSNLVDYEKDNLENAFMLMRTKIYF